MHSTNRILVVALLCLLVPRLARAQVSVTHAGSASVVRLPNAPGVFSPRTGLALTFDPQWANNYGYHPFRVTIDSRTPAIANRSLVFELHAMTWDNRWGGISVTQQAVLPMGSKQVVLTVDVPEYQSYQWAGGGFCSWDLYVDGRRDKNLSLDVGGGGWYSSNSSANKSVLAIGASATSRVPVIANGTNYEVLGIAVAELPTRWIEYTSFDVIAVSLPDLRTIVATRQPALVALCRWLRAGGQLWVTDVGPKWEQLVAAEQFLSLADAPREATSEASRPLEDEEVLQRGWRSMRGRPEDWNGRRVTFVNMQNNSRVEVMDPVIIDQYTHDGRHYILEDQTVSLPPVDVTAGPANKGPHNELMTYFVERQIGFGKLRLFRDNQSLATWKSWLLRASRDCQWRFRDCRPVTTGASADGRHVGRQRE